MAKKLPRLFMYAVIFAAVTNLILLAYGMLVTGDGYQFSLNISVISPLVLAVAIWMIQVGTEGEEEKEKQEKENVKKRDSKW